MTSEMNVSGELTECLAQQTTRAMLGFKAFHLAAATLSGIEAAHVIRKKQFQTNHASPFK